MRFDQSQHMRMGQHMKLAPHMIQSMEILQMPLAALEERIEQELESNATLELAEGEIEPAPEGVQADGAVLDESRPMQVDEHNAADDFERLGSFEEANPEAAENNFDEAPPPTRQDDFLDRRVARESGEGDAKSEAMANTAARPESPAEQLLDQWRLCDADPVLKPLGELIVGYIEEDGYLRTPLATILEKAPATLRAESSPTPADMERALRAVQLMLEPPGIGARDRRECLLLQIDARELDAEPGGDESEGDASDWKLARTIVEDHLDDLLNNRLPRIAQKTGASVDEIKAAIDRIRTLSPAPGRQLVQESESPITPDAFVEYDAEHDRYYAYLNDRRLPALRINQEYAKMAKDKTVPKPTKDFIRTNLGNAQFLLEAIEQRNRTILRVVEAVVEAQREFFDFGPQAIKPLPMTKVAEQLGIHVATVSRAVAEKYLQTPRGIVPLRRFFTGGTTTDEGEEVSWEAIKAALSDVIEKEDKKNPLSDDQLADELKKRGLEIARRTVAKYRGQLGIPTGRLRKAY
ncbi:MAG: RNA polymerase factor sigma-54 [Phycisphaerales bacterium]